VDHVKIMEAQKYVTQYKVYIPNQYENIFFSPDFGFRSINSEGDQGTKIDVTFYDTAERKPWGVVFYRSADNRSHLTHNWGGFARENNLKKDDGITFYKLKNKRGTFLMIGVEKRG
jgi:hypothetical protein